jgi:hypothetical protein
MSLSRRDQPVEVYSYANVGADGVPGEQFTQVAAPDGSRFFWARKEPMTARTAMVAQQLSVDADWSFTFDLDAPVTDDGVLKHEGQFYRVTSARPSREKHELVVFATTASGDVEDNVVTLP